MSTQLLKSLGDTLKEAQINKERLEAHKCQIFDAYGLVGRVPILSALQLLILLAFGKKVILGFTERELVTQYINGLIKIRSDLKLSKNIIQIEINTFGVIDSDNFLSDLNECEFNKISELKSWEEFINRLSVYYINVRNIHKLARKLGFETQEILKLDYKTKQSKAAEARILLREILKTIPKDEQTRLLNLSKGHKGLKHLVRTRIDRENFKEKFNNKEKTFANRWSDILQEIKSDK